MGVLCRDQTRAPRDVRPPSTPGVNDDVRRGTSEEETIDLPDDNGKVSTVEVYLNYVCEEVQSHSPVFAPHTPSLRDWSATDVLRRVPSVLSYVNWTFTLVFYSQGSFPESHTSPCLVYGDLVVLVGTFQPNTTATLTIRQYVKYSSRHRRHSPRTGEGIRVGRSCVARVY